MKRTKKFLVVFILSALTLTILWVSNAKAATLPQYLSYSEKDIIYSQTQYKDKSIIAYKDKDGSIKTSKIKGSSLVKLSDSDVLSTSQNRGSDNKRYIVDYLSIYDLETEKMVAAQKDIEESTMKTLGKVDFLMWGIYKATSKGTMWTYYIRSYNSVWDEGVITPTNKITHPDLEGYSIQECYYDDNYIWTFKKQNGSKSYILNRYDYNGNKKTYTIKNNYYDFSDFKVINNNLYVVYSGENYFAEYKKYFLNSNDSFFESTLEDFELNNTVNDVNGNFWRIRNGIIQKYISGYWKDIYQVNKNMTNISVYDDNHMIVTGSNEGKGIYTAINLEWKLQNNKWYYLENGQGSKGWKYINNQWYFFNNDSTMATGWVSSGSKWYFMDNSGAMKTDWIFSGGKWYYLDPSGAMKTGWITSGGKWYYMDNSGAMITGWIKDNNKWYYLDNSGAMKSGWIELSGKWYYLYSSGEMATNTIIDGYKLGSDGAWIK